MNQWQPRATSLTRSDRLLNKIHAFHAVADVGIERVCAFKRLTADGRLHGIKSGSINIGKGFEEGLGMPRWEPTGGLASGVHVGGVGIPRVDRVWVAVFSDKELVGIFLMPFEAGQRAIDFDPQIVLVTVANL